MKDTVPARRLWVIDPSLGHPETQGVAEVLDGWSGPRRIFQPALRPGDGPGPGSTYETDGVVLLGSRASVHDPLPWLDDLTKWLAPLLDGARPIPLLGICFGHQLIAHMAGARIEFARPDREKLLGVDRSAIERSRLLGKAHDLRVVVSHREVVSSVPAGYRIIACRADVPIDGIEHEDLLVQSFQFHPEAREEFAGHAGIPEEEIDSRVRRDGRELLEAFRRQVRDGQAR